MTTLLNDGWAEKALEASRQHDRMVARRVRRKVLLWSNVKALADLAILTRASFLMLLAVPILAGIWNTIESALPEDNFAVGDLPIVWSAVYFASLFSVAGQLFFQLSCPEMVRTFSRSKYVESKVEAYNRNPNHDFLASQAKLYGRRSVGDVDYGLERTEQKALFEIVGEDIFRASFLGEGYIQEKLEFVDEKTRSTLQRSMQKLDFSGIRDLDKSTFENRVIGNSAEREYALLDTSKPALCFLVMVLYAISVSIISSVIVWQSILVLQASKLV